MIKWLSGSRLKTGTENESPSPYTNDPLAAITGVGTADGKCHIYAVSRVNPLFNEGEPTLKHSSDETIDQRLSPRKSISSGYESRCNSSSDSSSCTECEDKRVKKPVPPAKREKRLTKQSKSDKKKRSDHDKRDQGSVQKSGQDDHHYPGSGPGNVKRRPRRIKNGSTTGPSILSPIPEGKVDCSIPPPIWPRFEERVTTATARRQTRERSSLGADVPGRIYHNGTTNPVNFMFKYNERYPKCCTERGRSHRDYYDRRTRGVSTGGSEYEHNWVECCQIQCGGPSCFEDIEDSGKGLSEIGKAYSPNESAERLFVHRTGLTHDVLRDLANLIAYAMSNRNSASLADILKNLADSIQKSLDVLSETETENNLKVLCDNINRNKYLSQILATVVTRDGIVCTKTGDDTCMDGGNAAELTEDLRKLSGHDDLTGYNSKDELYSSGSEGKNSSSSSSGCKDLYMSSNNSSSSGSGGGSGAGKDFVYIKGEKSSSSSEEKDEGPPTGDGPPLLNLIHHHHQRELSSSSAESAFGSSDISPPLSDSSSAKGVLNPVFLHEDIYSVPKSVRNALICDSYNRTKNGDCGGSVRNCGSSAYEKLISAKRKTSRDSQMDDVGPLTYADEGKTRLSTVVTSAKVDNTILKKVEHPYYVAIGRPDFTLDLPQAEQLMKKIASSKRRRWWCRFMTSIFGLVFFLLSVMMVSLVITKGRRMFGAL